MAVKINNAVAIHIGGAHEHAFRTANAEPCRRSDVFDKFVVPCDRKLLLWPGPLAKAFHAAIVRIVAIEVVFAIAVEIGQSKE